MNQQAKIDTAKPRYGVDAYLDWVDKEGLPVTEDFGIDLYAVQTAPWARYGVKGAAVHLKGRGDFANMFVLDIPPGGATSPQRHLYEDVYYVLEGSGSTQIEFADGKKRSFEWGPRSLFAIPLNAKHRHFNASGRERALLATTTDLPLVMNTFHNGRRISCRISPPSSSSPGATAAPAAPTSCSCSPTAPCMPISPRCRSAPTRRATVTAPAST
jgi:mannose-6-phosphate isomerase-like protein (cupin superfamily)